MTISGLRGRADKPSAPLSVAVFGVASGLCLLAAILMAMAQWPDSTPGDLPPTSDYLPALVLASLALLGAILCAGFACLIAVVHRLGR
jgi:hypothetical protein